MTPAMSAQYLYASSLLNPNRANQLDEVVIKGKAVNSSTISPTIPWIVSERTFGYQGIGQSFALERLYSRN